jgi:hypothetical protein
MLPGSARPASLPCRPERQGKPRPVSRRAGATREHCASLRETGAQTPAGISRCSRSKLASWAKRGLTSASPALTSSTLVFLLYQKGRDARIFQAQDRAIDDFTLTEGSADCVHQFRRPLLSSQERPSLQAPLRSRHPTLRHRRLTRTRRDRSRYPGQMSRRWLTTRRRAATPRNLRGRLVPLTTISTCRPQREQASRSRRSRTAVPAPYRWAISRPGRMAS